MKLWAKNESQGLTLEKHSLDAEQAASLIFEPGSRLFENWCRMFGIRHPDKWLVNLRVACLFHDLGKAGEDFQKMVRGLLQGKSQLLRHEHLSLYLMGHPSVWDWLSTCPDLDVPAIASAVLSHHMKSKEWLGNLNPDEKASSSVKLFWDDPQVKDVLTRVGAVVGRDGPVYTGPLIWDRKSPQWRSIHLDLKSQSGKFQRALRKDPERKLFHVALKAALMVCDAAASALAREKEPFEWITDVLHKPDLTSDFIDSEIIQPRARQIQAERGSFTPNDIQKLAPRMGLRALIRTQCGSGKTLAAYFWTQAVSKIRRFSRIIYLYPTRATATEGFKDYVGWSKTGQLLHSSAEYDLERILSGPEDSSREEARKALYALGHWPFQVFSATVDQFLSFVSGSYSSICLLPLLCDSVVIFDEIHSYDRHVWKAFREFSDLFDVPVLGMTATLQGSREEELRELGFEVAPGPTHPLSGQQAAQDIRPRYNIRLVSPLEAVDHVSSSGGKKVLWVTNTVGRCQTVFRMLDRDLGPLIYHSRYILSDRQQRHEAAMEAFKQDVALVVTTQVAEMSLDIDADILITELATIQALIQRLGRAARGLSEKVATVLVYIPEDKRPYTKKELELAEVFLQRVLGDGVSQQDLTNAAFDLNLPEKDSFWKLPFLEDAFASSPSGFREPGVTVPCILDRDLEAVSMLSQQRKPVDGFVINLLESDVGKHGKPSPEGFPRYLTVVDSAPYSSLIGYDSRFPHDS